MGLVIQDLIADALCVELVPKSDDTGKEFTKEEMRNNYGSVQLIGRISLMFGFLLASFIGGYIAQRFTYKNIVIFLFIIPIFSGMSILFLKKFIKQNYEKNRKLLYLILSFGLLFILCSIPEYNFKEEVIFIINLFFTVYMFKTIISHLTPEQKTNLILVGIVIFAYRIQPTPGSGIEWWQIDVLKFTPMFFAILNQISMILGFIGTWILSPYFLRKGIFFTVVFLSIIELILKIPIIGMAYGLHEWTMQHLGFGAKTIALIDISIEGPFSVAFMVPMLALSSYYAPKKNNIVVWFALTASWFNIPFALGRVISKHINHIFIIERGVYTNVSDLLIYTSAIGFIFPVIAVIACQKFYKKTEEIRQY